MVIFYGYAMFVALERRISDISISPAGGEPTATPHGAAGAARAADVPAGSATPARTPAAMPQGAAGTAPSGFASGRRQLESAIKTRRWPDGKPLGNGHSSPYLQHEYAAAIAQRRKTFEGRPGGGWLHGKRGRMDRGRSARPHPGALCDPQAYFNVSFVNLGH